MKANKQKKNSIYCIGVLLCLLTACQQVPQEVMERKTGYQDNNQIADAPIQYSSIEELSKYSIKNLPFIPQNLELPDSIDFSEIKEVNLLTLEFSKDYSDNKGKIAAYWNISNPTWEPFEGTLEGDTGYIYENSDQNQYLFVGDNGTVSYIADQCYTDFETDEPDKTTIKLYIDRHDNTEINCTLCGKKTTISEQINWVETWLRQCELSNHDFDYKVKTIYLREKADGTYRLSLQTQLLYKGISLDYFGGGIEENNGKPVVRQMDNYINLDIVQANKISRYNNNGNLIIKDTEKQTKVIDFPSAVRLVEKELSGFQKVKISDIKILYALYPDYEYENGENYYAAPGNTVSAVPVYSFMIPYGEDISNLGISEGNLYCYINVNMLTGDITSNLKEKGFTVK